MSYRTLPILGVFLATFWLFGCKGDTGPTGPAGGSSLTGSITGIVTLVQSDGSRPADVSGATVSIDGASPSSTTDANGKWTITGLASGIYSLTLTKAGYATSKIPNFQFVGGGTAYAGKSILAQPPNFSVTIDQMNTTTDYTTATVAVAGTMNVSASSSVNRVLIVLGTGANVSGADASKYLYATTYGTSGTSFSLHINKSDLEFAGFTSGASAYVVVYPLAYGTGYTSYLDQATGRTVYASCGPPSTVVPVTIP